MNLAELKVTTFYVNEPDPRRRPSVVANVVRSSERRKRIIAEGACRHENLRGTHGPATHGRLCSSCYSRNFAKTDPRRRAA